MKPPGYFIKCKSTRVKINNFSVKCFIPESEILHSIRLVFTSYHKKKKKKKSVLSRHKLQNFHDSQSDVVTCLNLTGGIIAFPVKYRHFINIHTDASLKDSSSYRIHCRDGWFHDLGVILIPLHNAWIHLTSHA